MELVQYNEYPVRPVDTDDLVLKHQGISSYSAGYAPMCFPLFMGQINRIPTWSSLCPIILGHQQTKSWQQNQAWFFTDH